MVQPLDDKQEARVKALVARDRQKAAPGELVYEPDDADVVEEVRARLNAAGRRVHKLDPDPQGRPRLALVS